jgi:DNA primase|tara:strand:+ start:1153 stop:2943 length:1791 start_codon:yes stop_codon:yes gene_type:complete
MKYPKEYLDEIKLRLKVSAVVGKSVQLKKRGKEFIGLSPFKNEKSPSFTVSDEKEFYHCFSTGEHGNIFDFIMKTKSMGFGEAVKILAVEAGMQPFRFTNFDEKKEKKYQTYKNIFKEYSDFYNSQLFEKNNKFALDYLEKRNLNKEVINFFKLGYVPWKNNFYDQLIKKYTEEEINLTGLYYKSDKTQKYVDRFNSRIIFPINNLSGATIAFGGRIIKESKLAKYINSPETEFYKKGRVVFNLDNAKSMRQETDEVIVVEGYMDVVSLYTNGIKNVVSNSGTALTENQIELIWKFFSNPTICLDGDLSGQSAAIRIAERLFALINENNKIYFSALPNGEDPDDFIKKNGKVKFKEFLKEKIIIQDYILQNYSKKIDKNDPYAISKFEKEIKKLCYTIKDETLRKYILEDFLKKINEFTPLQNIKNKYTPYKGNYKYKNLNTLKETKKIYNQKNKYTKEILQEFSIMYLIINYLDIAAEKIEEISNLNFSTMNINNLKDEIIKNITVEMPKDQIKPKLENNYLELINEININSNIKIILKNKSHEELAEILDELILEFREIKQVLEVESYEKKLINSLDETSYSELVKLKSQINRE